MKLNVFKRKKLNNKGFTLIELLAVVVILAVVMGVAATSVLGSMNNSRKGSLLNSAQATAQAFQNKYSEAMVSGSTTAVLSSTTPKSAGYNFAQAATTSNPYYYLINQNSSAELNLSKTNYSLETSSDATISGTKSTNLNTAVSMTKSFVIFDGSRIVACLIVPNTSSYYVGGATKTNASITVLGQKITMSGNNLMWACSDDQKSW